MRQPILQTTEPLNSNPKWPEGYIDALRQAGAHEKNIPYCVSWVKKFFLCYPDRPIEELGRIEIETFLSETAQNLRVSNWQVQQARNAIETYYEKFRGIPLSPRTEGVDLTISRQTISVGRETKLQTLSFPTSSGYYREPSPAVKLFSASIDKSKLFDRSAQRACAASPS